MEDVITNLQRKDDKIFITFKDFPEAIRKEERAMPQYPDWVEDRFGDDIPEWAEDRWGDDDD